jgi:hypothetical protein
MVALWWYFGAKSQLSLSTNEENGGRRVEVMGRKEDLKVVINLVLALLEVICL